MKLQTYKFVIVLNIKPTLADVTLVSFYFEVNITERPVLF